MILVAPMKTLNFSHESGDLGGRFRYDRAGKGNDEKIIDLLK